MEVANKWVIDCLENHEHCRSPSTISQSHEPTLLPARVIKILDDDNLRLVSGASPERYTILSYCWGGTQKFSSTIDTIKSRRAGFKTCQLPQTLQDAVKLTRSLGLEYLWIDVLCIIQDSPNDKEIELPKMPSYYRNAYLTICAGGGSCETGFLATKIARCEDHPNTGIPKDLLNMPYFGPNGEIDDIFFREESPYSLSDEPVSKRAWTFQERILSPRVLTYGSRMMWQCTTTQKSDGGVQDWSFDSRSASGREIKLGLREMQRHLSLEGKNNVTRQIPAENHSLWYKAVEEFCERDMTYPQDKFRAIAALANEFAVVLKDDYVAGLWKADFFRGLLWSTWPSLDVRKPDKWRAPSWSWASVESSVTYSRLPTLHATELAKVISIEVTPKSKVFPYGEISAAAVEIEGPVFSFDIEVMADTLRKQYLMPEPQDSMEWRKLMMSPAKGHLGSNDDWTLQAQSVFLLLLVEPVSPDDDGVDGEGGGEDDISARVGLLHGLVLTPLEDGTYERVSSFSKLRVKGYLNLCNQEETVRIV
ncbi:uncharacterized protein A1O9_06569 [Exophiala aquamarina CBS 119918]|uniref:Heterokaryon incompatibility domain-containing protein n=1 Tax=Exophiala aquamarina CBS 119918 TaxID=1182545 RepID=A0A072PH61_9EURO|nr:uncharacterized protein A1O9_06569 [Exophiala aquamarina CBS 119918]KEF58643.1 hypothetical protein A1O9_06569 [Exophiala aquamarina CBS 119918]